MVLLAVVALVMREMLIRVDVLSVWVMVVVGERVGYCGSGVDIVVLVKLGRCALWRRRKAKWCVRSWF